MTLLFIKIMKNALIQKAESFQMDTFADSNRHSLLYFLVGFRAVLYPQMVTVPPLEQLIYLWLWIAGASLGSYHVRLLSSQMLVYLKVGWSVCRTYSRTHYYLHLILVSYLCVLLPDTIVTYWDTVLQRKIRGY